MVGVGRCGSSSSSGEEDGDASWRAAIDSIAAVDFGALAPKSSKSQNNPIDSNGVDPEEQQDKTKNPGLKLYQIKAQNILDDLLDRSLEIVRNPIPAVGEDTQPNGRIQLFRKAPPGIADPADVPHKPQKRPRILRGVEVDEKSKKFRRRLRSVVVDGEDVVAAARDACQRSLARYEARDAAAKEVLRQEQERVAQLKRIRGEKWLSSIAREMQGAKRQ